jgi:hypothetical protein
MLLPQYCKVLRPLVGIPSTGDGVVVTAGMMEEDAAFVVDNKLTNMLVEIVDVVTDATNVASFEGVEEEVSADATDEAVPDNPAKTLGSGSGATIGIAVAVLPGMFVPGSGLIVLVMRSWTIVVEVEAAADCRLVAVALFALLHRGVWSE